MGSSKPPMPPAEPDLPEDPVASSPPADLVDVEIACCRLEGIDLSSRDARGLRLVECRADDVELAQSVLEGAGIRDVVWRGGSVANARADRASMRRARFEEVRATGVSLVTCHLEDATFTGCRMDLATFRFAHLERVRFERCRLSEADFYEADLTSVVFEDCDLTRASWSGATFERSEMRGCDLAGAGDPQRLRGVRMPWADVIRSAGELARAAGIEIID